MPSDVICNGLNLGYIRIINTPSYLVDMEHSKDVSKTFLKRSNILYVLKASFERFVHRVKLILSSQGIIFKAFKFS